MTTTSDLTQILAGLAQGAAASVVAHGRPASPGLNAALLRRLASAPGEPDSWLADPVFESAKTWERAKQSFAALAGGLLHPRLVDALDRAPAERMARDVRPYRHQVQAFEAAREGRSYIVTSGTGSGKTECFMIPILDDLLRAPPSEALRGVSAIVIYPLNALIESQRERLAAWTAPLKDRVRFALYNSLTPETRKKMDVARVAPAEIGNRQDMRASPPGVLVTNVTMLEYLLLRARDKPILDASQGRLRWIVLDEAHSYIGAQAAEMALLLRRVRAAFGVSGEQTRLVATSATISEGEGTRDKLAAFVAGLAGVSPERVAVIEGRAAQAPMPAPTLDAPLADMDLRGRDPAQLWAELAPHPRLQALRKRMGEGGVTAREAARLLIGQADPPALQTMQALLDAAASARESEDALPLLPWRAHVFHRALGGVWACVDAACTHRDAELHGPEAQWPFGAIGFSALPKCACGAPVHALRLCEGCGAPHLLALEKGGARPTLHTLRSEDGDDFLLDAEPQEGEAPQATPTQRVLLSPARDGREDVFLRYDDGAVFDNAPLEGARAARLVLRRDVNTRDCCAKAEESRLAELRYGPGFLMGHGVPFLLERLAEPAGGRAFPAGGRRLLTFSDSRQGSARLAAKLQQEAERNLTRAFLYHSVQQSAGPSGTRRTDAEKQLEALRALPVETRALLKDQIAKLETELSSDAKSVPWTSLVNTFAQHPELSEFAGAVWRERYAGHQMADDPTLLAAMFLKRELARRPKYQNNAETLGLMRLAFPDLEARALAQGPHARLAQAGVDAQSWVAIHLTAIDAVFRENLAFDVEQPWMVGLITPRLARLNAIYCRETRDDDFDGAFRRFPAARPKAARRHRLVALLFALLGSDPDGAAACDEVNEILDILWSNITVTAAKDAGGGGYRLDFARMAAARVERAFLCPETRRLFGYSPAGRSPYDPKRTMSEISLPRPPCANLGGLDAEARADNARWLQTAPEVAALRRRALWTNLHDRAAIFAAFLRAQEHSAQIDRRALQIYEDDFRAGRINLLSCSTTMEMGVDIPNVRLVINANTPPSVSNYRQRVGRMARRNEPFATAVTYCRDLPHDRAIFADPKRMLNAPIPAPAVRLDSPILIARHVHAFLLGHFLRLHPAGFQGRESVGVFLGAAEAPRQPPAPDALGEALARGLAEGWGEAGEIAEALKALTRGTALAGREVDEHLAQTAAAFKTFSTRWRDEHEQSLLRAEAAHDETKDALRLSAKRMRGEFLLAELARRGFTPAYGFPVDVVAFDHLTGRRKDDEPAFAYGERRGGASRTLDVALREYAPGSEIVIDGLVHLSEGVRPAWSAEQDASGLEDLQRIWECRQCRAFGMTRQAPSECPSCGHPQLNYRNALRPVGFMGRKAPHTGYERLQFVPFEMPKVAARGSEWIAMQNADVGRFRADPVGETLASSGGPTGFGYALCLDCGRAVAEPAEAAGGPGPMPAEIQRHRPLAPLAPGRLVAGYCPGGAAQPGRVQRHLRLAHLARTDVFELQLPRGVPESGALALAAALRESLCERLGADPREIGVAAALGEEERVSAYLLDRASGGAGLSARLTELDWLAPALERAAERLRCPEDCETGCPACVLRPDLNFTRPALDRRAGLKAAEALVPALALPPEHRVLGPESRPLGASLLAWIERRVRLERVEAVTIYWHGAPADWDLSAFAAAPFLARLKGLGLRIAIALPAALLIDRALDLPAMLAFHRLAALAEFAHVEAAPRAQSHPVVATLQTAARRLDVVALDVEDSTPGEGWGGGRRQPLVFGPGAAVRALQPFDTERLIAQSVGNAHLLRVGTELDGPARQFGERFWHWIGRKRPLVVAALTESGVEWASYTDRYLVTPLTLILLRSALRATPGLTREAEVTIASAKFLSTSSGRAFAHHDFADDATRDSVLKAFWPSAQVRSLARREISHARILRLRLNDGRRMSIFMDQGFGAWRSWNWRHDFAADPQRQARALSEAEHSIAIADPAGSPLMLELEASILNTGAAFG